MLTPSCNLPELQNFSFLIFLFLLSLIHINLASFQATASSSHLPIAGNLESSPFFIYLLPIKHFILQFIALHKLQLYPDYILTALCISFCLCLFILTINVYMSGPLPLKPSTPSSFFLVCFCFPGPMPVTNSLHLLPQLRLKSTNMH